VCYALLHMSAISNVCCFVPTLAPVSILPKMMHISSKVAPTHFVPKILQRPLLRSNPAGQSWDASTLNELELECVSGSTDKSELTSSMDPEMLSEFLMETGALSVVIEDADKGTEFEQPIFNQPSGDGESWYRVGTCAVGDNYWRRCSVKAYYSSGVDIPVVLDSVVQTFGLPAVPRYTVNSIPDQDWIKVVQKVQKKKVLLHMIVANIRSSISNRIGLPS
jgi:hypothetical protein